MRPQATLAGLPPGQLVGLQPSACHSLCGMFSTVAPSPMPAPRSTTRERVIASGACSVYSLAGSESTMKSEAGRQGGRECRLLGCGQRAAQGSGSRQTEWDLEIWSMETEVQRPRLLTFCQRLAVCPRQRRLQHRRVVHPCLPELQNAARDWRVGQRDRTLHVPCRQQGRQRHSAPA